MVLLNLWYFLFDSMLGPEALLFPPIQLSILCAAETILLA